MLIGLISDTHGLLRPEAEAALAGVAGIVHAGDVGSADILPRLARIAPVTAVRGNVDTQPWADDLPETATLRLGGRTLHVLHDLKALALDPAEEGIDVVVSGHSHKPRIETVGGVLHVNPGAAGRRRFRLPVTLAVLEIDATGLRARLHDLAP